MAAQVLHGSQQSDQTLWLPVRSASRGLLSTFFDLRLNVLT